MPTEEKQLKPVPAHLTQYVDYINNTGQMPLSVAAFDEDWEPVGPKLRVELAAADIIQERDDGIHLRPDLWSIEA